VTMRLICLAFGLAMLAVGMAESSLALVALGTAIVALALVGLKDAEPVQRAQSSGVQDCTWHSALPHSMFIAGFAAAFSSVAVALSSGDSLVGLSVLAWLLAIGELIALGLALDGLTTKYAFAAIRSLFSAWHRPELGSVLVIAGVAMVLRFYDLDVIPAALHGDEGEMGRIALSILNGDRIPFFKTAPVWGPTYPYNYVQAFGIWLFGSSVASLRTVSVLAGVLCVPVVYGIGRIGWGPVAGAIAAWLLAVSHLHIHYSRLAQSFAVATLLTALTMLFLALAARQAQRQAESGGSAVGSSSDRLGNGLWTFIIAAGSVAGLSQHVHHSTKVVPVIAALLLLYMLRARWIGRRHVAAFGFAFLVVYAPLAAFYVESPGDFLVGLRDVSAFRNWYVRELFGPEASLPWALPALLAEQVRRTLGLFIKQGDLSGYYTGSLPTFDVVTATLIWLGLGAAVSRLRRYHESALLVWFGLGLVFGSVFTVGAEHGHRILIVTPAAFLLGGVALARAWVVLRATPVGRANWLAAPAGTTLALWVLAANVVMYFFGYER